MKKHNLNIQILDLLHFKNFDPIRYAEKWYSSSGKETAVLSDDCFLCDFNNNSWSLEIEEVHEKPTQNGWIDSYERNQVLETIRPIFEKGLKGGVVVEFGASIGYMIEELRNAFPSNFFIATDLMNEGLQLSYRRNPDIAHIKCDFTQAPFMANSVDFVYSLNVLEHIENDAKTISECYRILKHGGYCLFVVPRGEKLYDYFDEMLFHKRRYATNELFSKCNEAGFEVEKDFHFAWLCYPMFWLKKKINRFVGRKLSKSEKIRRVKMDINHAMNSPLAIFLMWIEYKLSKFIQPSFGVREFILCKKI